MLGGIIEAFICSDFLPERKEKRNLFHFHILKNCVIDLSMARGKYWNCHKDLFSFYNTCIPQNPQWGRYPHIRRSTWSLLTIDFLLNLIEDCSWIKTFTKTCSWQNVNNCTFSLLSSIYICSKYYFQLCTVLDIHGKPMNVGSFSFQSIIQNLVL